VIRLFDANIQLFPLVIKTIETGRLNMARLSSANHSDCPLLCVFQLVSLGVVIVEKNNNEKTPIIGRNIIYYICIYINKYYLCANLT